MPSPGDLLDFILESLLQEIVIVIAGVLVAQTISRWWELRRYGGWRVEIWKDGKKVLEKPISPGKMKMILDVPEDMGVFLKGLISPFGWLNCDLMGEGPELGLLRIGHRERLIMIDMDKNPPPKSAKASAEYRDLEECLKRCLSGYEPQKPAS